MRDMLASTQETQTRGKALFQAIGSALLVVFEIVRRLWQGMTAVGSVSMRRAVVAVAVVELKTGNILICDVNGTFWNGVSGTVVMVEKVVVVVVLVC